LTKKQHPRAEAAAGRNALFGRPRSGAYRPKAERLQRPSKSRRFDRSALPRNSDRRSGAGVACVTTNPCDTGRSVSARLHLNI
jgi:hypothetical protein